MKLALLLGIAFISQAIQSSPVKQLEDSNLAHLLATQVTLYDNQKLPNIRVIQYWNTIAECGGTIDSCPDSKIMIILSSGDLYEPPKLFTLPPAKGWEIHDILHKGNSTYLTLKTNLKLANISIEERNKFKPQEYLIEIDLFSGNVSLADSYFLPETDGFEDLRSPWVEDSAVLSCAYDPINSTISLTTTLDENHLELSMRKATNDTGMILSLRDTSIAEHLLIDPVQLAKQKQLIITEQAKALTWDYSQAAGKVVDESDWYQFYLSTSLESETGGYTCIVKL